jgi:solute:Na+ symporter, SSS family
MSLSFLDLSIIAAYLVAIALFGGSFYRRRTTARDYFLGGRSMPWVAAGISIVAADLSAITVLGMPAWSYRHDLEFYMLTLGTPLAAPIVIRVFIPFYTKLNLYTAYEYLEKRFNLTVRVVTSGLFQILRGCHVAVAMYAPSLVINQVTGIPTRRCVIFMGLFTTVYTTLGGIRGVIWTDVVQFATVTGSLVLMIYVALSGVGGSLGVAYHTALASGHLHLLNFSLDPSATTAFWPCILGGTVISLSAVTTDQAILQRLFTTKSARDCRQSVILQSILVLPIAFVLYIMGTALFVFYHSNPSHLSGLKTEDAILPFFAIRELHSGFAGLVIAAIFAASMAVISAGINSLTTATTIDFYQRLLRPDASPERCAHVGRLGTICWGLAATAFALYANRLGELVTAYIRVQGFIAGPMLGIFLLGVLTRRSVAAGALLGAGAATGVVVLVSFRTSWSFLYDAPIGLAVTLVCGYATSLFLAPPEPHSIRGLVIGEENVSVAKMIISQSRRLTVLGKEKLNVPK